MYDMAEEVGSSNIMACELIELEFVAAAVVMSGAVRVRVRVRVVAGCRGYSQSMNTMSGLMRAVLHWGILRMAGPLEVVKVSLGSLKRGWVPGDVSLKKRFER